MLTYMLAYIIYAAYIWHIYIYIYICQHICQRIKECQIKFKLLFPLANGAEITLFICSGVPGVPCLDVFIFYVWN